MKYTTLAAISSLALSVASAGHAEPQAEVLHWWTAGGEANNINYMSFAKFSVFTTTNYLLTHYYGRQ